MVTSPSLAAAALLLRRDRVRARPVPASRVTDRPRVPLLAAAPLWAAPPAATPPPAPAPASAVLLPAAAAASWANPAVTIISTSPSVTPFHASDLVAACNGAGSDRSHWRQGQPCVAAVSPCAADRACTDAQLARPLCGNLRRRHVYYDLPCVRQLLSSLLLAQLALLALLPHPIPATHGALTCQPKWHNRAYRCPHAP